MARSPDATTGGGLTAVAAAAGTLVLLALPPPVSGQERGDCSFLCRPALAFETRVAPLRHLAQEDWLGSLEIEGALDYLATGVPQAGDEVPKGEVRYLDDGAWWGISVVAIAPLAPLPP